MVKYSTEYDIRGEFMYQNINESTKTIRDTWEFENTSIDVIKFEDEKERFPVLINNIKKIYSSCSSCLHYRGHKINVKPNPLTIIRDNINIFTDKQLKNFANEFDLNYRHDRQLLFNEITDRISIGTLDCNSLVEFIEFIDDELDFDFNLEDDFEDLEDDFLELDDEFYDLDDELDDELDDDLIDLDDLTPEEHYQELLDCYCSQTTIPSKEVMQDVLLSLSNEELKVLHTYLLNQKVSDKSKIVDNILEVIDLNRSSVEFPSLTLDDVIRYTEECEEDTSNSDIEISLPCEIYDDEELTFKQFSDDFILPSVCQYYIPTTKPNRKGPHLSSVSSFISTIGFPEQLEDLELMLEDPSKGGQMDLEFLLYHKEDEILYWTSPISSLEGDIIFFYHGISAFDRIDRMTRKVNRFEDSEEKDYLLDVLSRAKTLADKYAGKIFGCALIDTDPSNLHSDFESNHTVFAPINNIYFFKNPIDKMDLEPQIKISRAGAITYLTHAGFNLLKAQLKANNDCPEFLETASFIPSPLKGVRKNDVLNYISGIKRQFINAKQLKKYFVDALITKLVDTSQQLKQAFTEINGRLIEFDYAICIKQKFIPILVKHNIEDNIYFKEESKKLATMTELYATTPNGNRYCIKSALSEGLKCIIIDTNGISYINKLGECNPLILSSEISKTTIKDLITKLEKLV